MQSKKIKEKKKSKIQLRREREFDISYIIRAFIR